jgi:HEAT repeat protein
MGDAQAVPIMIEGLRESGNERRQAAIALAEIGMPAAAAARDALAEALPRTTEVDRAEVAWAMVVVNDPRGWDTIVDLLGSGKLQQVKNLDDPPRGIFDAALVARMAGRERLVRLAADSRVPLRRIAAISLAEMASPEVFDTLVTLSRDSDADVAREAAVGLGRTGDNRAGAPILAFLNAHPDARDTVLNALSQNSGAPGLSVIIANATNVETRAMATRLLRELQDPGAGDTFMQVLGSIPADTTDEQLRTIRKNAIFGLAEIGDARAADGLMELAMRPLAPGARVDPNVDQDARLALDALRKIPGAPARAKAQLLQMLPRADFMRTQVLVALGYSGDASLGPQLMTHMSNPDSQEGAAVAVAHLGYQPGIQRVLADMRRPANLRMVEETVQDEPVFIRRRNAIRAIAWTRDARYAQDLMRIVEDPLDRRLLREEAGHSLAAIADDAMLEQIATRATEQTRPEDQRLYYLYALRARSTPAIATRLVEAYLRPGVSAPVMRAAAIAAGFGGDASTAAALRPLLESTDGNVKLNAGIAAVLSGDEETARTLLAQLGRDREFAELMSGVFVTRSATGNNQAVQQEPFELLPLTESMFTDGRIYRRVQVAYLLEHGPGTNHHDFAMLWLRLRIRNGWEHPLGIGPHEVRARIREAASGADASRREQAFRMLKSLNDRGSLLYLRRQPGEVGEQARRALLDLNAPNG